MSRDETRKLLGGYATGTLTREEEQALFAAALDDQDLFDALSREQALRDLLSDPAARGAVLAALDERPAGWWQRASHLMMRPAGWGVAAACVAAFVGYSLWQAQRRAAPAVAPPMVAENRIEKPPAPAAPEPVKQDEAAARPARTATVAPHPKAKVPPSSGVTASAPPPTLPPSPPTGKLADQQPVPEQQLVQKAELQAAPAPQPQQVATPMFQKAEAAPPAAAPTPGAGGGGSAGYLGNVPRVAWSAWRRAEDGSLTAANMQTIRAGDRIVVRLTPFSDGFLSVARAGQPEQILVSNQRVERAKPIDLPPLSMDEPGTIQLTVRIVPPALRSSSSMAGISARRADAAPPAAQTITLAFH